MQSDLLVMRTIKVNRCDLDKVISTVHNDAQSESSIQTMTADSHKAALRRARSTAFRQTVILGVALMRLALANLEMLSVLEIV